MPCAGAWLHLDEALAETFCSIFARNRDRSESLDFRALQAFLEAFKRTDGMPGCALDRLFSVLTFVRQPLWRTPASVAGLCPIAVQEAAMYRRPSLIVLLTLFLAGCYGGPGYYESDVYTQPTTVVAGGYGFDNGYRSTYYQERRIYVAPQPRYYQPQPRYYTQPRYYGPPPGPRYYQPGRPPGYGWRNDRFRDSGGYRGDYRSNRGWEHGGGRDHGGRGDGRGRGEGRGGHR